MEHHVLRADPRGELALEQDAHGLGNFDPDISRPPGVRHVGRPDSESKAPERPGHTGVAVGTRDDLPGKRDLLDDLVVANRFGANDAAVLEHLSVELDAPARGEVSLHGSEQLRLHVQTHVAVLLAHYAI